MDGNENLNQNDNNNDLKNETINTVKDVKETVKNINIKEEAQKSKSYLKELMQDPIGKIKSIAEDKENKHFKTAIFAIIIWTVVALIDAITVYNTTFSYMMKSIVSILKLTITPILSILVLSIIVFVMNKENKKSLNTIITTIVTVKLPVILAEIIGLLSLISKSAYKITTPISGFLGIISTVLVFFGIKSLFDEEDNNKAIKKFALVMGVFYIVKFVLTFLEIYI